MKLIVSNPPLATIYRCEHGGIHLICQNVNIGLQPGEFCALNREVQQALNLVKAGIWSCSHLSLAWHTTVMCLCGAALIPLAEAMAEAAETVEKMEELEDFMPAPDSLCRPRSPSVKVFPGSRFTQRGPLSDMPRNLN